MMNNRLIALKMVLWTLVGVLAAVTTARFVHGLGAVTNLSDAAPWGLWIGFDVMSGVALAAGGFVLAAAVYVFGLERYRPFVRPAVLTALLGYAAVAVGLLYDLGLPWRIWHPAMYQQYHSVLFEVAMCVMLYLLVLSLEFAPVVLEHPLFSGRVFQAILSGLKRAAIPLVIGGIVLSTLHQSSLGSLFLITIQRLHPLWYSPYIYVLFFVSAVGLGLMMVVLESLLSRWFIGHEVHAREVSGLGLAASVVLWLYLALRLGDLALRGKLAMAVDGSWQGLLFLLELGVSALLPATLLLFRRVRSTLGGVGLCAALTVFGMVLYRLDVSIIAIARPEGSGYFPSWEEFAVSLGIVSFFALIFIYFAEHLRVYEDVWERPAPDWKPIGDPTTSRNLLPGRLANPRRNTGAALVGAAVALLFRPMDGVESIRTPTHKARHVEGIIPERGDGEWEAVLLAGVGHGNQVDESEKKLLLMIDGNRNGDLVLFNHDRHRESLGGDASCGECHHLSMPFDRTPGCFECHRDMYESTSVFAHQTHVEALGGNAGCSRCHAEEAEVKSYQTITACMECHRQEISASSIIASPPEKWRAAPGYMNAMHDLCVKCHQQELKESPGRHWANLDQCINCHDADRRYQLRQLMPARAEHGQKGDTRISFQPGLGEGE